MSLIEKFADWFETTSSGQDEAFISRAPNENRAGANIWWFRPAGGSNPTKTVDGNSTQTKVIEVYYRDTNSNNVIDKLDTLADEVTCAGCLDLSGFNVLDVEVTGPFVDQDLDSEERSVGLLQISISTYMVC